MIVALLFILSIVASSVVVIFYKSHTEIQRNEADAFLMIFWSMMPLALVYTVICAIAGFDFNAVNILTGVAAGVLTAAAILFLLKAMRAGELTVAVIIINLNFCIPVFLSVLFLHEKVSPFQLIGILVLVGVIILTNLKMGKKPAENVQEAAPRKNGKILLYAFIACISNGLVNFMIKLQQYNTPGAGQNTFYFAMYAGGGVACLIAYVLARAFIGKPESESLAPQDKNSRIPLKIFLLGLGVGLCTAVCMYPQSLLPKYVSASVQFTVTASGAVLLSLLIAFFKYREKPNLKNVIGTVCCLLSIFLQLFA